MKVGISVKGLRKKVTGYGIQDSERGDEETGRQWRRGDGETGRWGDEE